MPRIELRNISKFVLKNLNLTVEEGEIVALIGPNGAGKSTLLNIIAGLIDYEGEVYFDGVNMNRTPPHRRGVGYLFQDLALFPHLNVFDNISYGLKIKRVDGAIREKRVNEMIDALRIGKLKDRYPANLSGGEKQRVAIARTLAPFYNIVLLDEPTASLDGQTGKYLRFELRSLLKKLGITAILVTHDLMGAEEIADRIAIIHQGRVEQIGRPEDIFFNPASQAVKEFTGTPNILNCESCLVLTSGLVETVCNGMKIILPYEGASIKKIAIPPHDIYISDKKPPGPALNRYTGEIFEIIPIGSISRIGVLVGGNRLYAEMLTDTVDEMGLKLGQSVHVIVKLRRLKHFEAE
ncbi:MAG: ABC transporter ATP-binding protein [Syntrophorhabdaceae bacterium]|nr:ABC transporter ATP-binding protein [Syntrophorhabdaceae bacterium]